MGGALLGFMCFLQTHASPKGLSFGGRAFSSSIHLRLLTGSTPGRRLPACCMCALFMIMHTTAGRFMHGSCPHLLPLTFQEDALLPRNAQRLCIHGIRLSCHHQKVAEGIRCCRGVQLTDVRREAGSNSMPCFRPVVSKMLTTCLHADKAITPHGKDRLLTHTG